jgi:sigma-B regulation protein RsbU (phosphoserine phosphatase)
MHEFAENESAREAVAGTVRRWEMPHKILVVDDEPDLEILITQKFRKRIREHDLDFVFAGNGQEALAKLESNGGMDVVLTDINMPVMDGLTLLSNLRQHHPMLRSVIVSAYGDMSNIRMALNRGAFDFITKPIDFRDLEITLDKTIREAVAQKEAAADRERLLAIQKELDVAREIQESIVPREFPPFPEREDVSIHATMLPAKEVGGDFFDFFLIDRDRIGFAIGDVSGKGVPAALFMAVSRTLLRATASRGFSPDECMQQVNQILHGESISSMFVTCFYGVMNTRTGELQCSNGGHNLPYLLHADGRVEAIEPCGGLILGAFKNAAYEKGEIMLQPGDCIFLYTDGIPEAMNPDGDQFSPERLVDSLQGVNGSTVEGIVGKVIGDVKEFTAGAMQSDDMTILAIRYDGKGGSPASEVG